MNEHFQMENSVRKATYKSKRLYGEAKPLYIFCLKFWVFLESCQPAVELAPLHFRFLQTCVIQQLVALNNGVYHGTVHLNRLALEELQWWFVNIHQVNGNPIFCTLSSEMSITSDSMPQKWGGVPLVTTFQPTDVGHTRKTFKIKVLKLKDGFLAIQQSTNKAYDSAWG